MRIYRASREALSTLAGVLGPGPWTTTQVQRAGWSRGRLDAAVARGDLVRLRRGLYDLAPGTTPPTLTVVDAQVARMTGLLAGLSPDATLSHESAAYVHRTWTPRRQQATVQVTIPGQSPREEAGLHVRRAPLPPSDVVQVGGLRVTSVARTAVDLAREADLPGALVATDGALRRIVAREVPGFSRRVREGRVPDDVVEAARDALLECLARMTRWPGSRTAASAIAAADLRSESPFESWSRGWMLVAGLPQPEVNVTVRGASGRCFVGDFVWDDRRVIGEADGVGKYGSTTGEIRAALRAERERQADLEAAGWRVVRWVVGDPGATIVARLGRALYLEHDSAAAGRPVGG